MRFPDDHLFTIYANCSIFTITWKPVPAIVNEHHSPSNATVVLGIQKVNNEIKLNYSEVSSINQQHHLMRTAGRLNRLKVPADTAAVAVCRQCIKQRYYTIQYSRSWDRTMAQLVTAVQIYDSVQIRDVNRKPEIRFSVLKPKSGFRFWKPVFEFIF